MRESAPEACANCGASIPRGAKSCPECGADEATGWREQSIYDGLDLPDEESDPAAKPAQAGLMLGLKITGIILVILAAMLLLRS